MKRWALIIITITASLDTWATMHSQCESELTMNAPTKNLVAYLSALVERQIVGDSELAALIKGLDSDALVNPISENTAATSSARLIHREKLKQLLSTSEIERGLLRDWAYSALKEKSRVKEKREEAREKTVDLSQKMLFETIPNEGPYGEKSQPFALMTTPVTQKMWVEVMGENPSFFANSGESAIMQVNGNEVRLLPDNPVENATLWSILEFANRLSVKHGLTPVYDMSRITFDPKTRAENGTLYAEHVKGYLEVNAQTPNFFEPNGYRLPLAAEIMHVRLSANISRSTFERDWYSENSNDTTHPVGLKEPYLIEGARGHELKFYDLDGNVREWAIRSQFLNGSDLGASNDLMPDTKHHLLFGLAAIESSTLSDVRGKATNCAPNKRSRSIGFRLARTIK